MTAKSLVASNSEVPRLMAEDLKGLGYEALEYRWYQDGTGCLGKRMVQWRRSINSVWWACTTAGLADHRSVLSGTDLGKLYRELLLVTLAQKAGFGEAQFFSELVTTN